MRQASIVISAATEKPTRLAAAEKVIARTAASTTRRCGGPAKRPPRRRSSSPTAKARPPTRSSSCASMWRARCGRRSRKTAAEPDTDGKRSNQDDGERAGRALGAAARRACQGHRPRRIRPQSAPARHALRQDLPQHGRARPHHEPRRERGARGRGRVPRGHHRRRPQRHPQSLLRSGLSRPADPRRRQGALCRRAGCGGAGDAIRMSPKRRRSSSSRNTRNCRRCSTRSRR